MYEGKKNIQQKYLCVNIWVCHRRRIYCFKKSFLNKIIAFFADRFVPLDGHSTTWRINQLVFERLGSLNYLANQSAGIRTTRISQLPGESISWYLNDADLSTTWRIDQLVFERRGSLYYLANRSAGISPFFHAFMTTSMDHWMGYQARS